MNKLATILHFLTPLKNVSPFDVNMAADAGFDHIVPYTQVTLEEIRPLVQDAIFSRAPAHGRATAMLIGGRDPLLALDMLEAAKAAMLPPMFAISVMADPSGAFTTAAAMIAMVEKTLRARGLELADRRLLVFGATGPVGRIAGLMAALAGARVTLVGHDGPTRVRQAAGELGGRFNVWLEGADGSDSEKKKALLAEAEIVLAAGKAGVRVLEAAELAAARALRIAVDVNAVPPSGIEGLAPTDAGKPLAGTEAVGIGALAVGQLKFKTEHALLASMRDAEPRRFIGIEETLAEARALAAG